MTPEAHRSVQFQHILQAERGDRGIAVDLRGDLLGVAAAQVEQHQVWLVYRGRHKGGWCSIDDRADLTVKFVQQASSSIASKALSSTTKTRGHRVPYRVR